MKQGVYEASSKQHYPLGTRYVRGGRVWYYTRLATTTFVGGYGGVTGGKGLFSTAISSGALTIVRAAIGEHTVTISNPALVVDAYAGGLFTMYEAGQPICIMGIVSNTATVITLDGKLPGTYAAGANDNAHVIPGPYHEVILPGDNPGAAHVFDPCMGIFNSPLDEDGNVAAAGDYVWTQTWGICNVWCSATYEGDLGGQREVVMCGDGAANIAIDIADTTRLGYQRIGFLYPCTGPAVDDVANHAAIDGGVVTTLMNHIIFLQITP